MYYARKSEIKLREQSLNVLQHCWGQPSKNIFLFVWVPGLHAHSRSYLSCRKMLLTRYVRRVTLNMKPYFPFMALTGWSFATHRKTISVRKKSVELAQWTGSLFQRGGRGINKALKKDFLANILIRSHKTKIDNASTRYKMSSNARRMHSYYLNTSASLCGQYTILCSQRWITYLLWKALDVV